MQLEPNPVLSIHHFNTIEHATHQESGRRLIRRDMEERIAKLVIADLLACGYSIGVNDGEENVLTDSTDAAKIFESMFGTDDDRLFVHTPGETGSHGWVYLVYGNDGPDVINDYTTNLEKSMPRALELTREYI